MVHSHYFVAISKPVLGSVMEGLEGAGDAPSLLDFFSAGYAKIMLDTVSLHGNNR